MFRLSSRLGAKAPTIGVIVDRLGDPYQANICHGIEQGAAQAGANLLLFVGGTLQAGSSEEPPRQQIYQLAGRHNLDGLIVLSSTLSHQVGREGVQRFCDQFAGLPLCSLGLPLPKVPSVTIDNEAGMSRMVRHLIEQHRARRVAFISGPAGNDESAIRVGAYRAVLAEHGLVAEDQLVVEGNFMVESGALAVGALVDRLGQRLERLDAIVAANDNMAIGAMDELANRGIAVPARIAVVGFDDIEEARLTEPSLTTARQPLARIGTEAVRRLLQTVDANELELHIATETILRKSCGCSALDLRARARLTGARRFEVALMGQRDQIAAELGRSARGRFSSAGAGWEHALINALFDDLLANGVAHFLPAVERLMVRLAAGRTDLNAADDVLSVLREMLVPLLQSDAERYRLAEDLFHAARLSTSAFLQRGLGRANLTLTRWTQRILATCNALAASASLTELQGRAHQHLPQLGLRNYFVCMYDRAGDSSAARLVLAPDNGTTQGTVASGVFRGRELLPREVSTADADGRVFAVLPLLGTHAVIGHVLFEYTAQLAFTCGALADALGIALRRMPEAAAGDTNTDSLP